MATGPCEAMERMEEAPQETPKGELRKQLKEESKEDTRKPSSQEEMLSTPNGIGKEEAEKLHVVDKDLEEFVDSVTEVAQPARIPPKPAQPPPKAPAKLPRAEQVAEKVLRAEKVTERPPPRVEKAPEKTRPAGLATPKTVPTKRKTMAKETLPWEGLTLNKCLVVASLVALLSVSCQVIQDIIDYSENVLKAELEAWSQQESTIGELDERWFYEKWFDWSDTEEPPDIEEEEEEELVEMENEEKEEMEDEAVAEKEEDEEVEEEEEPGKQPVVKGRPKKSRREKPAKEKRVKGLGAGLKEKEDRHSKKGKEEKEESKAWKRTRRPKEGGDEVEKGHRKTEKDSKAHERKERKPQATERSFFPSHKVGKPKGLEGKRRA